METVESFPPVPRSSSAAFHQHTTLVLNADYQPLSYPLTKLSAEDTIKDLTLGRFNVVTWSNTYAHSVSTEMRLPGVVSLKEYAKPIGLYGVPNANLEHLFVRDMGTCQYTGNPLRRKFMENKEHEATIDHVIPQAQNGSGNWDNVVLASWRINNLKGNQRPEQAGLTLRTKPWIPRGVELLFLSLQGGYREHLPEEWQEFLQIKPTNRLQRMLETIQIAA